MRERPREAADREIRNRRGKKHTERREGAQRGGERKEGSRGRRDKDLV